MQVARYMTGVEWENFKRTDQREYILSTNQDFLKWLDEKMACNYRSYVKIEQLQSLIDFIAIWYEIRFPLDEYSVNYTEEGIVPDSNNRLASVMDYEQLLLRLSPKLVDLLHGEYRGSSFYSSFDGLPRACCQVGDKTRKLMGYITPQEYLTTTVSYDMIRGVIDPSCLTELRIPTSFMTLEALLSYLDENQREDLEYSEVRTFVFYHQTDLELRKKVLELVPLKLIYTSNSNLSIRYARALQMIYDFNRYIPGLDLDTSRIDEIMNQDYSQKKSSFFEKIINKH